MTKKGTILSGLNFRLLEKPFKINRFQQESPLGIDIAEKNALLSNTRFAKKARPRAIVERLPTFIGGGITGPKMEQRRKTTPACRNAETACGRALHVAKSDCYLQTLRRAGTGLEASGLPGYRRGETLWDPWFTLTKTLFQEWSGPKSLLKKSLLQADQKCPDARHPKS
jgi:hypothetical protein